MTLRERATTRISETFAEFISGLSPNENAAMRALMLLGAAEIGVDPALIADDVRRTIGARLPREIVERLLGLLTHADHDVTVKETGADVVPGTRRNATKGCALEERGDNEPMGVDQAQRCHERADSTRTVQQPDPFGSIGFDFDDAVG